MRWVENYQEANEYFVQVVIQVLADLKAQTTSTIIFDFLMRAGLEITDARAKCYDEASVMKGEQNGVAAIMKSKNGSCLFVHCHGHFTEFSVWRHD